MGLGLSPGSARSGFFPFQILLPRAHCPGLAAQLGGGYSDGGAGHVWKEPEQMGSFTFCPFGPEDVERLPSSRKGSEDPVNEKCRAAVQCGHQGRTVPKNWGCK